MSSAHLENPGDRQHIVDRLLTGKQLKELHGIPYSREHLYRLARDGAFPAPLRLGGNKIAYRESEILAWIDSRPRAISVRVSHAPSGGRGRRNRSRQRG